MDQQVQSKINMAGALQGAIGGAPVLGKIAEYPQIPQVDTALSIDQCGLVQTVISQGIRINHLEQQLSDLNYKFNTLINGIQ